jgi:hypothetical protein
MTDKKKPQVRAPRKTSEREVTPDDTAERLAALLECERLPAELRDVLQGEVLAFIERLGGFIEPDVLRLMYPALCIQAGYDPLRNIVESLARPERLPKGAPDDASRLAFPSHGGLLRTHKMRDGSLSHLGIFEGDELSLALAKDTATSAHPIESGDMVLLNSGGEWHVGELRVEGDKVLLVSTYPAKVFRAKDVSLFGRVTHVTRRIAGGRVREGGA